MSMLMAMTVFVVIMIKMIVTMAVTMRTTKPVIGPVQRIERRDFIFHHTAKARNHVTHDMVINDAQPPVIQNLNRGVPVADVPGQFGGRNRSGCGDGQNRLLGCADNDYSAIDKAQAIPIRQTHRMRQIKQERLPRIIMQANAAAMPVGKGQGHRTAHFGCVGTVNRDMLNGVTHGVRYHRSEQEVTLRHRHNIHRLTGQKFTICRHLIGFRINFHRGKRIVQLHVLLADITCVRHRQKFF